MADNEEHVGKLAGTRRGQLVLQADAQQLVRLVAVAQQMYKCGYAKSDWYNSDQARSFLELFPTREWLSVPAETLLAART